MKKKFISLVSVITVMVLCQACASQKNELRAEVKPTAGVTTEVPGAAEVKVGDSLANS
jgi:hypothetical protein